MRISDWSSDVCSSDLCYRSLYLTESALDAVADGLGLPEIPYFTGNRIRDTALRDGFLALHRSLQDGTDALCEEERLLASFGGLFRRHGSGHKAARTMERALGRAAGRERVWA